MLLTVTVGFPAPPVTVALVCVLSKFTVTKCVIFVAAPFESNVNENALLTKDGFARRFTL